ncbi:MAG: sulfotransferase [Gemmatimonadota bacterium]|nr:sulfotransferase [Gemmatimonadota bacterium]
MNLRDHVRTIQSRWPFLRSTCEEEPIFILAAGWRSGSTLLQRMLMRHCFIWGEPFGRAMPVDSLAQQLKIFTSDWPPNSMFATPERIAGADLSKEWIANLYPPMDSLIEAHVGYFTTLFQAPTKQFGYKRWGFKEVRLSADHAAYLRFLFPRAKFVFLYRDPYACYRSFLALKVTYVHWPDQPIDSPERFGSHWLSLVESYLRHAGELDAQLIRYEELCAPQFNPTVLNEYLSCNLDLEARATRVGASQAVAIPAEELEQLRKIVEPVAEKLGYRSPAA